MPYYPPSGGGGGSGTPGGADSQIQVNSQNAFAGFPNLRWVGSSNELNLNTAGRIRKGGVAEVDGTAPAGVTGLIWLDTSSTLISGSVNTAAFVTTGTTISTTAPAGGGGNLGANLTLTVGSLATMGSANQFTRTSTDGTTWGYINFRSGSSTVLSQGSGFIQIDATTGGGSGGTKGWENYIVGPNTGMFAANPRRVVYAGMVNAAGVGAGVNYGVNTAFCVPLMVMRSLQIDSIGCVMSIAGGSSKIQMGIYTNSADNIPFPFQAIATSGFVTGSNAATNPVFATAQVLSSNTLYWLVCVTQIGTPTLFSIPMANLFPIFGAQDTVAVTPAGCLNIAMVGTLPSTMIGSGAAVTSPPPIMFVHISG